MNFKFQDLFDSEGADYEQDGAILKIFDATMAKDFEGFRKGDFADVCFDIENGKLVIIGSINREEYDRLAELRQIEIPGEELTEFYALLDKRERKTFELSFVLLQEYRKD